MNFRLDNSRSVLLHGVVAIALFTVVSVIAVAVRRELAQSGVFREVLATLEAGPAVVFFWIAFFVLLTLPVSPTTPMLAASLTVRGPGETFVIAYSAGLVASGVKYLLGRSGSGALGHWVARPRQSVVQQLVSSRGTFVAFALLQGVPHPLYDVVGYVAGALRVPFWSYVAGSAFGGGLLLATLCLSGSLVS